jgi:hypothetical protein
MGPDHHAKNRREGKKSRKELSGKIISVHCRETRRRCDESIPQQFGAIQNRGGGAQEFWNFTGDGRARGHCAARENP